MYLISAGNASHFTRLPLQNNTTEHTTDRKLVLKCSFTKRDNGNDSKSDTNKMYGTQYHCGFKKI